MSSMQQPLLSAPQPLPYSPSIHGPSHSPGPASTAASIHTTDTQDTIRPGASSSAAARPADEASPSAAPARSYAPYASEAEYLNALRAWAETKKYVNVGEMGLVGFYGKKTMQEIAAEDPPHLRLRLRSKGDKGKRRATVAVDGEGVAHGAEEVQPERGSNGRRRNSAVPGWMHVGRKWQRGASVA